VVKHAYSKLPRQVTEEKKRRETKGGKKERLGGGNLVQRSHQGTRKTWKQRKGLETLERA